MNEIRLLCIARIDLSCVGPSPDDPYDTSLWANAVPAGPLCWEGLLKIGAPRETDEREYGGYVLKAWVIDPIANRYVHDMEWTEVLTPRYWTPPCCDGRG